MTEFEMKENYNIDDLLEIMRILRAPDGCMWDREQDHHSIRRNFIEETYEACEAIDEEDTDLLREELGDVLLQVVFHTEMERERGSFNFNDVADGVCKKLIYRHPHIFEDTKVSSSDEILKNWEELKQKEKKQETASETLRSVAKSLPALVRAEKLQKRAAKVGFDWDSLDGAQDKVQEELRELGQAIEEQSNIEEEFGDLLFAMVNVSRFLKLDAERALEKACDKFTKRFSSMEEESMKQGKVLSGLSLTEMDVLWNKTKNAEKAEV